MYDTVIVTSTQLATSTVTTQKLAGEAASAPRFYTAADKTVTVADGVVTLIAPATFSCEGGGFIATVSFFASTPSGYFDSFGRLEFLVNGVVKATQDCGIRSSGGNTSWALPVTVAVAVNGVTNVDLLVRTQVIAAPGSGSTNRHAATNITMSVMNGKR